MDSPPFLPVSVSGSSYLLVYGVLAMYNGYALLSDNKLEIATEIQQLICEQAATLKRALEPNESVQYAVRNTRIRELFGRLGCRWATPAYIHFP